MSVRYAHTDITVPDFDSYRVKNVTKESLTNFRKDEDERKLDSKSFNYAVTGKSSITLIAVHSILEIFKN